MKNLYAKLLEAQKKIGAIKKEQTNPYFKSKYADINDVIAVVKPVMNEVGLIVLQHLVDLNGKIALNTIIADPESGESTESSCPLIENPDPQKMGAIITYYRRYALQSLLFLNAEDSDGNDTKPPVAPTGTYYEPVVQLAPNPLFDNSVTQQAQEGKIDYVDKLTKRVGAVCANCGVGKYIKSPKTGSTFCSEKCWTKKDQVVPPPSDMESPF